MPAQAQKILQSKPWWYRLHHYKKYLESCATKRNQAAFSFNITAAEAWILKLLHFFWKDAKRWYVQQLKFSCNSFVDSKMQYSDEGWAGPLGPFDHAGMEICVATGMLGQVVTPHEPLLAQGTSKLLLACVGSVMAGQLIRSRELFKAVWPCAWKRTFTYGGKKELPKKEKKQKPTRSISKLQN